MKKRKNKNLNSGFTLLELLVVVLIIGMLAGIALPQYQLAVGKSKYATLKNATKSLVEAAERYYLLHDSYPTEFADLDINFPITKETNSGEAFQINFPGVSHCSFHYVAGRSICSNYISKVKMYYLQTRSHRSCQVYSLNTNDIPNKICQTETGKSASQARCQNGYCVYSYK